MYNAGLSIQDCAAVYGISRQAMWAALRRREVAMRSNIKCGPVNVFYRGGVTPKGRCAQIVILAKEKRILVPSPCEVCGATQRVEAHHDDYDRPLDVRWLCHKHHYEWHREHKPQQRTKPCLAMSHKEVASLGGKASWSDRDRALRQLSNARKARK